MPKSVDGDIRISVEIDDSGVVKGEKNISKIMSSMSRGMGKLGKEISSAYSQGAAEIEKYTIKLAKAEQEVKKQEYAVQNLKDKLDALKNGDVTPQSLKKLDAEIAKAEKEFDELIAKMDAAKDKVNSLSIGAKWNPDLEKAKAEYEQLAEQVSDAGGKLDALHLKAKEIRLNPQNTAEGKKLAQDIDVAKSQLGILKTEAGFAAEGLERAKEAAEDTNKEIKKTPNALKKTNYAAKRFKQLIASAFVFNVFSKGLNALRDSLSSALKTNTQFSNSVAKIKGNLLTAFAPIYEAVLPAVNSLASGLSSITAQLAAFIATLSGTTVENASDAAENLYEQAKATDAVTDATKEAEKSLASFDEINKISDKKTSDEIVPDFSGITDVDTSGAIAAANKLAPVLEAFGKFASNLATAFKENIAPRLKDLGNALLDFLPKLGELDADELTNILGAIAVGIGAVFAIKIGISVASSIGSLGTALGSFLTTIGAHPVLAIAAGLSSLALAISAYENYKFDNSEFGKLISFYEDVAENAQAAIDANKAFREEAETKFKNIDDNFISLVTIADRYYDLSQKAQLSDSDKNLVKYYYDYLTAHGVDLTGKIDAVTKAYNGTRDELDELIKSQIKYAYVQAAQELLADTARKQLETQKELAEAEAALALAKDALTQADEEYAQATYSVFDKADEFINGLFGFQVDYSAGGKNGPGGFFETFFRIGNDEERALNEAQTQVNSLTEKIAGLKEQFADRGGELAYYSEIIASNGEIIDNYTQSIVDYGSGLTDTILGFDAAKESAGILGDELDQTTQSAGQLSNELDQTEQSAVKLNNSLDVTNKKDLSAISKGVLDFYGELGKASQSATDVSSQLDTIDSKTPSPDFSKMQNDLDTTYKKLCLMEQRMNSMSGTSFGTSAPKISALFSVPMLAQGAVIPANKPFLSILGDQRSGTNIETPLSTMIEAFNTALDSRGDGQNEAILEIDGEKFGRLIYKLNKKESKRVGVNFSNA